MSLLTSLTESKDIFEHTSGKNDRKITKKYAIKTPENIGAWPNFSTQIYLYSFPFFWNKEKYNISYCQLNHIICKISLFIIYIKLLVYFRQKYYFETIPIKKVGTVPDLYMITGRRISKAGL